jgi:hypothetical protein
VIPIKSELVILSGITPHGTPHRRPKGEGILATAHWLNTRWEEAEKLEVQAMETRKKKFGRDHPDMLSIMANLSD